MNDILIEREVNRRVWFKMGEFWDSFNQHMKRHEYMVWATRNKDTILRAQHYLESYEEIKDILRKEINLPTALDGEMEKNIWEAKEELVDSISGTVLKRGTHEYGPLKSFINNRIEEFING